MAVECVDVDVDIFENPGLAKCAKRLGISEEEMVGHLVRLWIWEIKLDNREASEHPKISALKTWPRLPITAAMPTDSSRPSGRADFSRFLERTPSGYLLVQKHCKLNEEVQCDE